MDPTTRYSGLITPLQLSIVTAIPINLLAQWRQNGWGPEFIVLGDTVMYHVDDVIRWIDGD